MNSPFTSRAAWSSGWPPRQPPLLDHSTNGHQLRHAAKTCDTLNSACVVPSGGVLRILRALPSNPKSGDVSAYGFNPSVLADDMAKMRSQNSRNSASQRQERVLGILGALSACPHRWLGSSLRHATWFPTPVPAAQDTVRPSARNYRPRDHARRCEDVGNRRVVVRSCEARVGRGWPRERPVWPRSRRVGRGWPPTPRTTKRPDVGDVGRWRGTPGLGYPLAAKWPRSAFLNRASLPLAPISRRIAL